MTDSLIDRILEESTLTPPKRLLLIVLARHARSDGTGAYPSLRRLQSRSGLALSYICTLLPELERDGYLTIHHRQGPKGGNMYDLHLTGVPSTGAPDYGTRPPDAPPTGTDLRTKEEKTPVLFRTEEHPTEELLPEEQHPAVTPAAANWLRTAQLSDTFAQVLQGTPAQEPPAPRAKTPRPPALYFQGKLCPGGHDDGTGHTLRRVKNGNCTECDVARTKAKRQAAAAERKAQTPRPARQVIDLAAHRRSQGG